MGPTLFQGPPVVCFHSFCMPMCGFGGVGQAPIGKHNPSAHLLSFHGGWGGGGAPCCTHWGKGCTGGAGGWCLPRGGTMGAMVPHHTTKEVGGAVGCPLCHLAHPKHFWCFAPCTPPTPHAAWGCTAHPQRGWVGGMWHHSPPTGCVGVGGAWGGISLPPHTLFGTPLQKVRNSELFPY